MKGDFTRFTYNVDKGYTGVRMQQGRVAVDADWNEQNDLLQGQDRAARADEVGREGGSWSLEPEQSRDSFKVDVSGGTLTIAPGRYELDGLPAVLDTLDGKPLAITAQPFWPGYALPTASGRYAVYLDIWEEAVNAIQDPEIREVALGGPDTATRTRLVWQVGLLRVGSSGSGPSDRVALAANADWVKLIAGSTGTAKVKTIEAATTDDPCAVPEEAGYSGLENQLYRIEIHEGNFVLSNGTFDSTAAARRPTWLWSRENGSVVTAWNGNGTAVGSVQPMEVENTGLDDKLGFAVGNWVELQDEEGELTGAPGVLARVTAVDAANSTISVDSTTAVPTSDTRGVTFSSYRTTPRVRRWDSPSGPAKILTTYADLESNIQARFTLTGTYRTGDYWLIPARALTGEIAWPRDGSGNPLALAPMGPAHHTGLLAFVDFNGSTWSLVADGRKRYVPLTEQLHLFYLSGGGQAAMPEELLRSPLRVGLSNGQWPVANATVRFTIEHGGGVLQEVAKVSDLYNPDTAPTAEPTSTTLDVTTDADGVAQVWWTMGADDGTEEALRPRVRAELLSTPLAYPTADQPLHLTVRFEANLAVARDIAVDTSFCPALGAAGVETVQDAIELLAHAETLLYVSGDGQCGMPGVTLPTPLAVRLSNGTGCAEGGRVRFVVQYPGFGGLLTSPGAGTVVSTVPGVAPFSEVVVQTGADNVAAVSFQLPLNVKHLDLQVMAQRLAADGTPTGEQIVYNIKLLVDRAVAYTGECRHLQPAKTVLGALELLCENAGMTIAAGDGQEGLPGGVLPLALRARVANGAWPVEDAWVMFEILNRQVLGMPQDIDGSGALKGLHLAYWGRGVPRSGGEEPWWDKLVVRTDKNGLASCQWMLGTAGGLEVQRVRATLLDQDKRATPISVVYSARVVNRPVQTFVLSSESDRVGDLVSPGDSISWTNFYGLRFASVLREPGNGKPSQWYGSVDVELEVPEQIYSGGSRTQVAHGIWYRVSGVVSPYGDHDLLWSVQRGLVPSWPRSQLIKLYDAGVVRSVDLLAKVILKPSQMPGRVGYGASDVEQRYYMSITLSSEPG